MAKIIGTELKFKNIDEFQLITKEVSNLITALKENIEKLRNFKIELEMDGGEEDA
ncbi:MAG: hypothetical protein K0Q87_3536 [Neobacillus sp.]|nr:hypothetical protein [Neobacillus sp.]